MKVTVIGAGLAGSEASYQLAKRGIEVDLYEMKKIKKSPAHKADTFAELVCSNSLRSNQLENAVGLLKEEMRIMDSLIIRSAEKHQVPAGGALAVDRDLFSDEVTKELMKQPLIHVIHEELTGIPEGPVIIATGPLTSDALYQNIKDTLGEDYLYFYDAAAPIVEADSINMDICYKKSRYDKGDADYINCPMTSEEFDHWYEELIHAKEVEVRDFEMVVFEGCMPFEEIAKRGKQTLLFGPMKPVGLARDGEKRPHAVVQLRQDNKQGTLYNIVGFQTHLTFGEQKRLVRMVPGLEKASIVRYGVMHRNTFINSPKLLNANYQLRNNKNIFFAGQITGVEGYVESAASGLLTALSMVHYLRDEELVPFPITTIIGSQADYISSALTENFQPMNANFGLIAPLDFKHGKKERKRLYKERALEDLRLYLDEIGEGYEKR